MARGATIVATLVAFLVAACAAPGNGHSTIPSVGAADLRWLTIPTEGGHIIAAVARPEGPGPFPVVVILHGSHGFAQQYVQLAKDLAPAGFLVVAPCWFRGGQGTGMRFIDPVSCPEAPAMTAAASPDAQRTLGAIVRATQALPDAQPGRIALFGHSRGGGAALTYALRTGGVSAVIANSAGYPAELDTLAHRSNAPLLILHGEEDNPSDGGSAYTDIGMARRFEGTLRRMGAPVETHYYPAGRHNGLIADATQRHDALRRIADFLDRKLR